MRVIKIVNYYYYYYQGTILVKELKPIGATHTMERLWD